MGKTAVKYRALGIYLFSLTVVLLAAAYFGRYLNAFFFLMIFFPLFSFINFMVNFTNLKYHQNFSTEHPVKGETVEYRIIFSNENFLPIGQVGIEFETITPDQSAALPSIKAFIGPRRQLARTFNIACPYRGIYTVGLKKVELKDLLRFFRRSMEVWSRTFYVYPRILTLSRFAAGDEERIGGERILPYKREPDYSLFSQLNLYHPGQSIKHLYWKKFALTGLPYLKEYDSTSEAGVRIYLDTSVVEHYTTNVLAVEDVSIEVLVALVKYFLTIGVSTTVKTQGSQAFAFSGNRESGFERFYRETSQILFNEHLPLSAFYKADISESTASENMVFFITHRMDHNLFNLINESLRTAIKFTIIINQTGYSAESRAGFESYLTWLRNKGARIIIINSEESIIEDLESYEN